MPLNRLNDFGMAITDRTDRKTAIEIEISAAIGILDVAALGALPNEGRIFGKGP